MFPFQTVVEIFLGMRMIEKSGGSIPKSIMTGNNIYQAECFRIQKPEHTVFSTPILIFSEVPPWLYPSQIRRCFQVWRGNWLPVWAVL